MPTLLELIETLFTRSWGTKSLVEVPHMTRFLFILAAAVNGLAPKPSAPASNPAAGKIRSGRAPSFSSQDLTNLVKNELAPKPWLPPTLSFRTDFPKTVAAVDELKNSLKQSVEAIPIYRSIQSKARRARDKAVERRRPPSPSRAPGLTSQDVASLVERELPSAKAKD